MKKAKKVISSRSKKKKLSFYKNKMVQKSALFVTGVLVLGVLAYFIIMMPTRHSGTQQGVGADGYSVKVLKGADLNIADVVKEPLADTELRAISDQIGNVNTTDVLDMNGNYGQTATYYFKATDTDIVCNFYTDVMIYQSQSAYNSDDVFLNTGDAGTINGLKAGYMPAATIGNDREYALLVTKGLKSFKFAIAQPAKSVTIDEETAHEVLRKIAAQADLDVVKR